MGYKLTLPAFPGLECFGIDENQVKEAASKTVNELVVWAMQGYRPVPKPSGEGPTIQLEPEVMLKLSIYWQIQELCGEFRRKENRGLGSNDDLNFQQAQQ
ncbi:MAG: hypothetical protein AAF367_07525 [Pseudomonadota bacterium]